MVKKIQKKSVSGKAVGIAAGVAGVAAVSAAAYMLFGPHAKRNQKALRGWAVQMKGDIIEKFEDAKELSEPVYQTIIDEVTKKYSALKHIDPADLEDVVSEIRGHWKGMVKTASKVAKKSSKKA
jgi:hypothetical protein